MAPWKENIYARARILNTKQYRNEMYAYIHFIDEGQANWVNVVFFLNLLKKLIF